MANYRAEEANHRAEMANHRAEMASDHINEASDHINEAYYRINETYFPQRKYLTGFMEVLWAKTDLNSHLAKNSTIKDKV